MKRYDSYKIQGLNGLERFQNWKTPRLKHSISETKNQKKRKSYWGDTEVLQTLYTAFKKESRINEIIHPNFNDERRTTKIWYLLLSRNHEME